MNVETANYFKTSDGEQIFYVAIVARKTRDIPSRASRENGAIAPAGRRDPATLLMQRS